MNWVYQKTGIVNKHLPEYQLGNQPVRALHNIVLYMFVHENDEFHLLLIQTVISKGMNPEVHIEYGDVPLMIEYGVSVQASASCLYGYKNNKKINLKCFINIELNKQNKKVNRKIWDIILIL